MSGGEEELRACERVARYGKLARLRAKRRFDLTWPRPRPARPGLRLRKAACLRCTCASGTTVPVSQLSRLVTAWRVSVGSRQYETPVRRHWRLLGRCVEVDQCCEARGGTLTPVASLNPGSEKDEWSQTPERLQSQERVIMASLLPTFSPRALAPSQI